MKTRQFHTNCSGRPRSSPRICDNKSRLEHCQKEPGRCQDQLGKGAAGEVQRGRCARHIQSHCHKCSFGCANIGNRHQRSAERNQRCSHKTASKSTASHECTPTHFGVRADGAADRCIGSNNTGGIGRTEPVSINNTTYGANEGVSDSNQNAYRGANCGVKHETN